MFRNRIKLQPESIRECLRCEVEQVFSQFDNQDNVQHEINPEVNITYNSLNLMLGQRGSGKTFNSFNEMAMICKIPNKYHLFIYVSNNPNDETYKRFSYLINQPIVQISYDEAESYLQKIIDYKQNYDKIKDEGLESKLTDACKKEFFETLHIQDFSAPSLHTLVLYDDAMNVFKKTTSKQFRWLLENRHTRFTYILCLQDWKGISSELKANLDSVWIFGGYPRNRYSYFFQQLACPMEKEQMYRYYTQLNKRDCIIIHNKSDGTIIRALREDGFNRELFNNCVH